MEKRMYVLIDSQNGVHYGFTFEESKARERAKELENKTGYWIDIYEFEKYEEF